MNHNLPSILYFLDNLEGAQHVLCDTTYSTLALLYRVITTSLLLVGVRELTAGYGITIGPAANIRVVAKDVSLLVDNLVLYYGAMHNEMWVRRTQFGSPHMWVSWHEHTSRPSYW